MINKYLAMGLGALIAIAPVRRCRSIRPMAARRRRSMHNTHKTSMSKHHAQSKAITCTKRRPLPLKLPRADLMKLAPFGGRERDAKGAVS